MSSWEAGQDPTGSRASKSWRMYRAPICRKCWNGSFPIYPEGAPRMLPTQRLPDRSCRSRSPRNRSVVVRTLKGVRVALLEARMSGEIADLVTRYGGRPYSVPAVREAPLAASEHVMAFLDR